MPETWELWERPQARHMVMLVGWRQWADAGSVSSGLPDYLIQAVNAHQIGTIHPEGFYLFQIPGTHDLVRPEVKFDDGYPESLEIRRNEIFFTGDEERGTVIILGDEPHLDIERYVGALLDIAKALNVTRIVGFGGVYGELPYNKERTISCVYSLPHLKEELEQLAVTFSDYHGGASLGSYVCRRAGDRDVEFVGLYAFVPAYSFSASASLGNGIRIENDFMAWLGVMRRVNFMLGTRFDLADLERRSRQVIAVMNARIAEVDKADPDLGVREYMARLTAEFTEVLFNPLADVWEEELRRLLPDDEDDSAESGAEDDSPPPDDDAPDDRV
jgi:hypothetical protein